MHASLDRCLATRRCLWGAIVVATALAGTGMVCSLAWADEAAEADKPSSTATESTDAAPAASDPAPAADSEPAPEAPAGEISKAPSDRPAPATKSSGDAATAEDAPPAQETPAKDAAAEAEPETTEEVEMRRDEEVEPSESKPDGEGSSATPEPSAGETADASSGETPDDETPPAKVGKKRVIGATANVLEKTSGFIFRARVDTGAKSCSMHVEKVIIENESEVMEENYGKLARILVTNGKDKEHWITARIESHVLVKTSVDKERRYKVPLTFRWKDCEKTVLVTLNDRSHMEFPLLLGRNFLTGDFIVDVELESND